MAWSKPWPSASREIVLREFGVHWLRLKLSKPGAVRGARAVGVIIERSAQDLAPPMPLIGRETHDVGCGSSNPWLDGLQHTLEPWPWAYTALVLCGAGCSPRWLANFVTKKILLRGLRGLVSRLPATARARRVAATCG